MVDMAPELLQQIQSDWSDNLKNDAEIKSLIEKINEGKATYKEVEDLSYRVGKDLSKSLLDNITEDILPNGHVPQNVAEKILHPTLNNAHNLVTNVAIKVQSDMNSAAEIGLRAQKTDYDKDRAQGLVHKLTNGQFEDTKWILDEPVTLFVQSVADNTLKKNVDFQAHSGLKPQIIRKASSKCCDWCEDLEGTYDYGSEPKDVYRRHERCKCSVDYNPGTGKRQDVWSKAWHEDVDKNKVEQRIKYEEYKERAKDNFLDIKRNGLLGAFKNGKTSDEIVQGVIANHIGFKKLSPGELKSLLEEYGYDIMPLGSRSTISGLPFEEGGGYRTSFKGDGYFQYHPEKSSHHNGAYYKINNGKIGKRYDLDGNEIKN